jgi:8-oxo-dGTP pyrophosphatase MutT (NUDIX family)
MNKKLPHWLIERLQKPLPGPMVGSRFEPHPRPWRHYDVAPPDARVAAVLVLLYPRDDHWWLPLTLRPAHLPLHAGQVSLPGGAIEPNETSANAAVREFHEELGNDGQAIETLGRLSPLYVQASNYLVTPWVAFVPSRPQFAPNPEEVETLLEVRLVDLLDPALFGSQTRTHDGRTYTAPHFLVQSHHVWGATCMILGELATLLEEISDL